MINIWKINSLNLIDTCKFDKLDFNVTDEFKEKVRLKKYNEFNDFFRSLRENQIKTNIYLKKTSEFMSTSYIVCRLIVSELKTDLIGVNKDEQTLEVKIPSYIRESIPSYINKQVEIDGYGFNKKIKVDILDGNHIDVYNDYNIVVSKIEDILCHVYLLQLNYVLIEDSSNLMCDKFMINDDKFSITFYAKENNKKLVKRKS